MNIEIKVLSTILNLSKNGQVTLKDIGRNSGILPKLARNILIRNAEKGYFKFEDDSVVVEKNNRVKLAVHIIELGADIEKICDSLTWVEFENISVVAFESSGFRVLKNFRFKRSKKRWEVDLLGFKNPLVLSVDCKHWHKGWRRSSIKKIVEYQFERTKSLMESSVLLRGKMGISYWKKAVFVPVIISLIPGPFKYYQKTPVVPVFQIRNFLNDIFTYTTILRHFSIEFAQSINEY